MKERKRQYNYEKWKSGCAPIFKCSAGKRTNSVCTPSGCEMLNCSIDVAAAEAVVSLYRVQPGLLLFLLVHPCRDKKKKDAVKVLQARARDSF